MNYTILNANINLYFKEIRSFANLTKADETSLFCRIAKGDQSAEAEIFNHMAKMAVATAKTYTNNPDLLEDLIQEANMGIITAIRKFDPTTGYRFSSYARWWMKAGISAFLGKNGVVHPCSMRIIQLAKKIREEFYKENQRNITEYELLDKLEEMGEVVTDLTSILNIKLTRIDLPLNESDDLTKKEFGEFADVTASDNNCLENEKDEDINDKISKLLGILTPRERILVKMKFGIGQDYEMDYKSIAKAWNSTHDEKESLTQERIRQLVVGALKKMKPSL